MGKGDRKSRKGKRWKGSFGVSRNRKAIKARLKRSVTRRSKAAEENIPVKPKRTSKKKAEA